ncbi:MAG: M18 family aminopeptidase [Muribaculaceae bacterium]|nr:M18 family aminopeptidase [Muribaculaceae bacterium]MBP5315800.1 M18 family aminopeptidase [Muribaculaceae bacterium]
MNDYISSLKNFLDCSPCNFWAVATIASQLEEAGFERLNLSDQWALHRGGRYYVTKNDSAIFAFVVGQGDVTDGFKIIAAHSDSPGFRIKPNAEIVGDGGVVKLNTEVYGGPILYTWFDRPLSISGRVVLRSANPLNPEIRLVRFDRPLLTIPHLAIHFNRQVNDGNKLSKQKDMLPVLGIITEEFERKNLIVNLVADELRVDPADILDFDLTLYDTTPACTVGLHDEFITSGRLDDLSMVHAAMTALLESRSSMMTRVMAIFDNEETGSGTKQGAASPVLKSILQRINLSLGGGDDDFLRAIASSFMISADDAHAVHPNYAEKHDPTNHPVIGGGPVIKINSNCKYMTDAESSGVFRQICEGAGVPFQYFVNHSDVAGGSTLGNILTSQIDLRGVDMGNPIWAMHSARETASVADHISAIKAFTYFYEL